MKKLLKKLLNSAVGRAILFEILSEYLEKIKMKRPHLHLVIESLLKELQDDIKLLKL